MEPLLVDDSPATSPSGKLGRYEIVKRLGNGGMADLLLARTSTGGGTAERHLVIKQLREDQAKNATFVKTFVAEARLAGALHHHNIVQVQDIGEDGGKHYLTMEYVHGEDLRTILARLHDRGQTLPIEHLVTIGKSVAAALHHAHEQVGADRKPLGMVHCDLTPTNILVGYDGNVKVVDFGIAKAALQTIKTQVGGLPGKVPYMAPEQCTGQGVDRRSDVFALGIVLYELATVRRLFKGESYFRTMATIVAGTVPPPSQHHQDIPGELDQIILKALARSPADRYQTAAELRTALDRFATHGKIATSVTALADYMKQLFGARPEPWLDGTRRAAAAHLDFDGAAAGLAQPPAETAELPAGTTSDSPMALGRDPAAPGARASTDMPTAILSLAKKPVALGSFVQPPKSEPDRPLPKPSENGKPAALLGASTDEKLVPPPRPKSITGDKLDPRPRSSTSDKLEPRPKSITGDKLDPRPKSSTSDKLVPPPRTGIDAKLEPRPKSSTSDKLVPPPRTGIDAKLEPRPRSITGDKLAPRPRSNTDGASSKAAGNRLPPPLQTPRSMLVVAPLAVAAPVVGAPPGKDRLTTDVDETTDVATPPPPPAHVASAVVRKPGNDSTQIVAPLPPPFEPPAKRSPRVPTPLVLVEPGLAEPQPTTTAGTRHRNRIVAGLFGAAAIAAVILVVVLGSSSDDVSRTASPSNPEPTAAAPQEVKPQLAPPPEPPRPERTMRNSEPPEPAPPPEPPRPERTMRNSEPPEPAAAPPEPATAPPEPAAAPPEPPRPERTMRNSEPPPTTDVAAQVPAEPPAAKVQVPAKHAATPASEAPPSRPSPPLAKVQVPAKHAATPASEAAPPSRPSPPTALAPSPPKRPSAPAVTHKPVEVAKPAAKPQAKPVKPPTYDPNALFLKKP